MEAIFLVCGAGGPQLKRNPLASDALSTLYSLRMTKIEKLEHEVRDLTPNELAQFREWFAAFDAAEWDRQFEADVKAGKLDTLADAALADHRAGRSQKL
jgi:hypothetical protein